MTTLATLMLAPEKRERIATQLAGWIDRYVAEAGGVKGFGMKAGLKALKALRPDALSRGVNRLLPDIVEALDPLFQQCRGSDEKNFGRFLATRNDEATAAIMAAVDRRALSGSYPALTPVYRRLRSTIEGELRKTLPKLVDRIGDIATA